MRCLMCEEPTTMYIPSDDVDGVGLHSCGVCGFEIEGPATSPCASTNTGSSLQRRRQRRRRLRSPCNLSSISECHIHY